MNSTRPTACVVTPLGRGAVATIVVAGPQAALAVEACFQAANGRPLSAQEHNRIVFGRWGGDAGEEVVACRRGEDTIEIHCHGGQAAAAAILDALGQAGCEAQDWRTWARAQDADPIRAAAVEALAEARTQRTAAILLDQWHGALRREVEEIAGLLGACPHEAVNRLDALLSRARLGLHLTTPFRVVLAGPPNVGKSSLINVLVGYGRAIVQDEPGTTRDVVTATTALDGWPVELADTAGLRAAADAIEAEGVARAAAQLAVADAIVLMFDLTRPWQPADDKLLAEWPGAIVVHNKADLAPGDKDDRPAGLVISAVRPSGINELEQALVKRLVPEAPAPGEAVPFAAEQVEALCQARVAVVHEDFVLARQALRRLVGMVT